MSLTLLLLLSQSASPAVSTVTVEDINRLAKMAKLTTRIFMQDSLPLRMRYEYAGKFLIPADRENLQRIAKRAGEHLQALAEDQEKLRNKIENYQGDDWDSKYGSTGLWKKIFTDLHTTCLSKYEIDFYLALASENVEATKILHKILTQINSSSQIRDTAYSQLLKAKIFTHLAQRDPNYKPLAKKELDALTIRSDMKHSTAFRIAIETIKLAGSAEPDRLKKLTEQLAQSNCANDLELALSLALLQRRHDPETLKKTVKLFPQTENLLGNVILTALPTQMKDWQTANALDKITVLEAELAAQAAWRNETTANFTTSKSAVFDIDNTAPGYYETTSKNYKVLMGLLSTSQKFRTPLILYVSAVKSAQKSPRKAVDLLIKASRLQQQQKSDRLNIKAEEIAKQASQLAYTLFARDENNCSIALQAFQNYSTIAREKIDGEIEYLYTVILDNCGRPENSRKLLKKIAQGPAGNYRNKARLELILQTIQRNQLENQSQRNKLLNQLSCLIADCRQNKSQSKIRTEALTIYCHLLLEAKDELSAQKVVNLLTEPETTTDPNLNVFKSRALRLLGRLNESADCLLITCRPNRCQHAGEAIQLLSEIIEKIDQFQKNDPKLTENCKKLAQFCCDCLDGQLKETAELFLIEISLLQSAEGEKKLSDIEPLLNATAKRRPTDDIDLIRCRARLLTQKAKFEEAAQLWAKLAEARKNDLPSDCKRSWKWWRAKFYELYCCANHPQTQKQSVLHTIEILENSFSDIPPLWAENLSSLKRYCRSRQPARLEPIPKPL